MLCRLKMHLSVLRVGIVSLLALFLCGGASPAFEPLDLRLDADEGEILGEYFGGLENIPRGLLGELEVRANTMGLYMNKLDKCLQNATRRVTGPQPGIPQVQALLALLYNYSLLPPPDVAKLVEHKSVPSNVFYPLLRLSMLQTRNSRVPPGALQSLTSAAIRTDDFECDTAFTVSDACGHDLFGLLLVLRLFSFGQLFTGIATFVRGTADSMERDDYEMVKALLCELFERAGNAIRLFQRESAWTSSISLGLVQELLIVLPSMRNSILEPLGVLRLGILTSPVEQFTQDFGDILTDACVEAVDKLGEMLHEAVARPIELRLPSSPIEEESKLSSASPSAEDDEAESTILASLATLESAIAEMDQDSAIPQVGSAFLPKGHPHLGAPQGKGCCLSTGSTASLLHGTVLDPALPGAPGVDPRLAVARSILRMNLFSAATSLAKGLRTLFGTGPFDRLWPRWGAIKRMADCLERVRTKLRTTVSVNSAENDGAPSDFDGNRLGDTRGCIMIIRTILAPLDELAQELKAPLSMLDVVSDDTTVSPSA